MTQLSREQHITKALAEYHAQTGDKETLAVKLRGSQILPVVELPLEVPVLNTSSFRIAPELEDHPEADAVRRDPESPAAQAIVGGLVRKAHRQAVELKESLKDEGQDQPGLITRTGKLINANTRLVLLRELYDRGDSTTNTIRVAVLPTDVTAAEELQLESILQKQREHKDEYNLVSEVMMIQKLHDEGGMTDAAIARQQRVSGGAATVKRLRAVRALMERARHLVAPPLPLTDFIRPRDKRQNWLELLADVEAIDSRQNRAAGDEHIRRWLIAYHSDQHATRQLRHAKGAWIERHVVPDLTRSGDDVAAAIVETITSLPARDFDESGDDEPAGLDVFGGDPSPSPESEGVVVQNLLNLVVNAHRAGDGEVTLPSGATVPASDVRTLVNSSVSLAIETEKARARSGSRLQQPTKSLGEAQAALKAAYDAIETVIEDDEFQPLRSGVAELADEVAELLEGIIDLLEPGDSEAA